MLDVSSFRSLHLEPAGQTGCYLMILPRAAVAAVVEEQKSFAFWVSRPKG